MVLGLAAMLAAAGFLGGAEPTVDAAPLTPRQPVTAESSKASRALFAIAGAATAAALYRTSDDGVEFYAAPFNPVPAATVGDALTIKRGGFGFSLTPISTNIPEAAAALGPDFREQSRNMAKAMPGYPQPAKLVIGVKVSF